MFRYAAQTAPCTATSNIHIVADDERIVAAEFEIHFLHAFCGQLRDASSGRDAAGERDHVRLPVRHQRLACFLAVAGDDVNDSFRQILKSNFSSSSVESGVSSEGLMMTALPAASAGATFQDIKQQRIIPRHDTDDHAVRFLHHEVHLMALHRRDDAA